MKHFIDKIKRFFNHNTTIAAFRLKMEPNNTPETAVAYVKGMIDAEWPAHVREHLTIDATQPDPAATVFEVTINNGGR